MSMRLTAWERDAREYGYGVRIVNQAADRRRLLATEKVTQLQGESDETVRNLKPRSNTKWLDLQEAGWVLLSGDQVVNSIPRQEIDYFPAQFLDEEQGVLMQSVGFQYESSAARKTEREKSIRQTEKLIADTKQTLEELRVAISNNEKALNDAAKGGAEEVSEIGAIYLEKHRLQQEVQDQENRLEEANKTVQEKRCESDWADGLFETKQCYNELVLKPGANLLGNSVVRLEKLSPTTSSLVYKVVQPKQSPK